MNSGKSPPTAMRVSGTVNENAVTPTRPHQSPGCVESSVRGWRVALLCRVMNNDSTAGLDRELRAWIATASPGARLPATRALVAQHGVSPVTVQKVMRRLSAAGLIETRAGVGNFVRAVRPARIADYAWQTAALGARPGGLSTTQRSAAPDAIDLVSGYPARELLPERLVRAALARAARTDAAITRAPVAGRPDLQSWFAAELGAAASAGIAPPAKVLDRDGAPTDLAHFEKIIRVNLIGTYNVIAQASAAIAQTDATDGGDRGVIVNTASVAAFDGQIGQPAYSASKGGVHAMTLPIARELARYGIRVCTIAPGIMETPMLAGLPEAAQASLGQQVLYPQRLGKPDEYASLVLEIVRNGYLNGETIRLDGAIRMAPT